MTTPDEISATIEATALAIISIAQTYRAAPLGGKVRGALLLALQNLEGRLRASLAILERLHGDSNP